MLHPIEQCKGAAIGNKARNILLLQNWGFRTPKSYCVAADIFKSLHQARYNRCLELGQEGLQEIESEVLRTDLPAELIDQLAKLDASKRWAVRSSALDEDGHSASFAGQYHSELQLSVAEVPAAIQRCYASFFTEHVAGYRAINVVSLDKSWGMAVLIQEMVQPHCAGVMFTKSPTLTNRMAVESVPGTAEQLLDGKSEPDRYWLERRGYLGSLGSRLSFLELGEIKCECHSPKFLDEVQLTVLAKLGLKIEQRYGHPQDIEWAMNQAGDFIVLQTRSITTEREKYQPRWTRQFLGERWIDPPTPLGWTSIAPKIEHLIGYSDVSIKHFGGRPALALFDGAPYLNLSPFEALSFKLPFGYLRPLFMTELLPEELTQQMTSSTATSIDVQVLFSFLRATALERRWKRFRWNPLTNVHHWERFEPQLLEFVQAKNKVPLSRNELLSLDAQCSFWVQRYLEIHVCSYLFSHLYWEVTQHSLKRAGLEHLSEVVLRAPELSATQLCNQGLWDVANGFQSREHFL